MRLAPFAWCLVPAVVPFPGLNCSQRTRFPRGTVAFPRGAGSKPPLLRACAIRRPALTGTPRTFELTGRSRARSAFAERALELECERLGNVIHRGLAKAPGRTPRRHSSVADNRRGMPA